jgi:hypothetical protein
MKMDRSSSQQIWVAIPRSLRQEESRIPEARRKSGFPLTLGMAILEAR